MRIPLLSILDINCVINFLHPFTSVYTYLVSSIDGCKEMPITVLALAITGNSVFDIRSLTWDELHRGSYLSYCYSGDYPTRG